MASKYPTVHIVENIKNLRRSQRLTQAQMAIRLRIKRPKYAAWEEGRAIPSIFDIREMSEMMKVPMEDFCFTDIALKLMNEKILGI